MTKLLLAVAAMLAFPVAAHAQCATGYTQLSNVFACQSTGTAIFSVTNSHAEPGWQGQSERMPIPTALLTNPGFTIGKVRVSFTIASTTVGGSIDAAYVRTGIASPAYDFAATPVQLTFNGGQTSVTGINGAQTIVSDFVPFTFNFSTAVSLLVSTHYSGTHFDTGYSNPGGSGTYYWLGQAVGTEAQTAPSGTWSSASAGYTSTIATVEVTP